MSDFDTELRTTLAVMAHEVDVPDDLAGRTIDHVRALTPSRRGFPRWAYVVTAAAAAVMLFVVGTFISVQRQPASSNGPVYGRRATATGNGPSGAIIEGPAEGVSKSGDAVSGQVSGAAGSSNAVAAPAGPTTVALNDLPKVVHTATISVQVRDFERAWPKANDVASHDGGYVTNSDTTESGDRVGSGTLTIKVPSGELDHTLADLRALGTMTKLTTSGNDVSAPMADLDARKKNAEAEEAQLQNLLNNANSVSDVLDIRNRLNDNRNEIESIEGQINDYQHQVDFATINATVFDRSAAAPVLGRSTLGRSMRTGAHIALGVLAGAIVALGALIPLAALALLGSFVLRRIRRRAL